MSQRNSSICVFCGSSEGSEPLYAEQAKRLGESIARRGIDLVYGGGNAGLMGAVSSSHIEAGGHAIGVIPEALKDMVPHRDDVELHVLPDMHQRKAKMYEMSDYFIALPGGIGTFEELFEVLTWNQLGYFSKPVGLLNVGGFYDELLLFLKGAVSKGFLKQMHMDQLSVFEHPDHLIESLLTKHLSYTKKWS